MKPDIFNSKHLFAGFKSAVLSEEWMHFTGVDVQLMAAVLVIYHV